MPNQFSISNIFSEDFEADIFEYFKSLTMADQDEFLYVSLTNSPFDLEFYKSMFLPAAVVNTCNY